MPNYQLHTNNEKETCGVRILPSQRTLRDFPNYIRSLIGFNHQIVNELATKTRDFTTLEKYVVLSFDEIKTQVDLVYDKKSGDLIVQVDLVDLDVNRATLQNTDKSAIDAHVFLV